MSFLQEPKEPAMALLWRSYIVMALISLVVFCLYFTYDSIGAIAPDLKYQYNVTSADIGLFYSAYSFPACLTVFLWGIALDKIGIHFSIFVVTFLIAAGSTVVALSGKDIIGMLIGRFILGCGGDAIVACQARIIVHWLPGSQHALGVAVSYTLSMLGTMVVLNVLPMVSKSSVNNALWLVAAVAIIGFILATLLILMSKCVFSREKVLKMQALENLMHEEHEATVKREKAPLLGDLDSPETSTAEPTKSLDDHQKSHQEVQMDPEFVLPKTCRGKCWYKWNNLGLGTWYWNLVFVAVAGYALIYLFIAFATDIIQDRWQMDPQAAARIVSISSIVGCVLGPVAGLLLDRFGHRVTWTASMFVLNIAAYFLLGYTKFTPIFASVCMGLLIAVSPGVIQPGIAMLVPEKSLGVAYGISGSLQNASIAVFSFVIGLIRQATQSYSDACGLLGIIAILGLIGSGLLFIFELCRGWRLQMGTFQKQRAMKRRMVVRSNGDADETDSGKAETPPLSKQRRGHMRSDPADENPYLATSTPVRMPLAGIEHDVTTPHPSSV
eukprot:gnl/Trimastix_PCT/2949.p1 GENE.gnl/Trimastix_PCT/2949~~gnl/Trimastix_PCT/2949.p1  ORF type:complete len:554 (-),score=93.35 gnl/Trimastix_PCT/2949:302-1963(-)